LYDDVICTLKHFSSLKQRSLAEKGVRMKIIGIVLAVVGVGFAVWGYQLSGSIGSEVTQAVTGADTDRVMTYYILGAVAFVVGIYLFRKN